MPIQGPSDGSFRNWAHKNGVDLIVSPESRLQELTDSFVQVAREYLPHMVVDTIGRSVAGRFVRVASRYLPHSVNWFLDNGPHKSLLQDPRAEGIYRYMQRRIPIDYEPVQIEYYIRHLVRMLKARDKRDEGSMAVNLNDPSIEYFTKMDSETRAKYLINISELEQDKTLLEHAKSLGVAVEELNGGVGSSMGMDPTLGLSKANIEFGVSIKTRMRNLKTTRSVMEAKLLHHAWLSSIFYRVHVIPGNGTHTEKGWRDFLIKKSTIDWANEQPTRTNAQYFRDQGLVIHDAFVQQGFPLLDEETLSPIESDDFERTVVPGGHGQHFYHLYFSGKLHQLMKEGVQVFVFANYDNLNATPNPYVAAKMVRDGIMAGIISTDRSRIDAKGGVFVVRNGKLDIIERAQVPEEQMGQFESLGLREGDGTQPFNTNTPYLNLPLLLPYLDEIKRCQGVEAIHELLLPETIQNKKTFTHTVNGQPRTEKDLIHLEGAIGSTILKFPGVKLFNADVDHRTEEFTPLKRCIDVVYHYDSDAFVYDDTEHQLFKTSEGEPPSIEVGEWTGWNNLKKTRVALGRPSFRDLAKLMIRGEVYAPDAVFKGTVEITNLTDEPLDLTLERALMDESDLITLADVRIVKAETGEVFVYHIKNGELLSKSFHKVEQTKYRNEEINLNRPRNAGELGSGIMDAVTMRLTANPMIKIARDSARSALQTFKTGTAKLFGININNRVRS